MPSRLERIKKSREIQNDEFYTIYDDIAAELPNYKEYFKGQRILCPCDWDESFEETIVYSNGAEVQTENLFSNTEHIKNVNIQETSKKIEKNIDLIKCNFIKFLVSHAEDYKIKSISVSGYDPNTEKGIRFQDIDYSKYDIVITNPPFSQFRDFIDLMFKNNMKFLVIGPQDSPLYKDCFEYFLNNKIWLGYHFHMTGFILLDGTMLPKNDNRVRSCCWFTNLDVKYRHDELILTEQYSDEYIHYDNFDGIDVNETKNIPFDYNGYMGVPVTFLQKYNPEQFEIIGLGSGDSAKKIGIHRNYRGRTDLAYTDKKGKHHCPFGRIIIKNKKVYKNED